MDEHSESEEGTFRKVIPSSTNDNVVYINGNPVLVAQPLTVVRSITGGARVLATPPNPNPNPVQFDACKTPMIEVKVEPQDEIKSEPVSEGRSSLRKFDEFLNASNTTVVSVEESLKSMETAPDSVDVDMVYETQDSIVCETQDSFRVESVEKALLQDAEESVDVEMVCETQDSVKVESVEKSLIQAKEELVCKTQDSVKVESVEKPLIQVREKVIHADKDCDMQEAVRDESVPEEKKQTISDEVEVVKVVKKDVEEVQVLKVVKKEVVQEKKIPIPNLEDGEFPEEPGWSLLGRKVEIATSTARGVRRLVDNEIVHFNYPHPNSSQKFRWIVRISTKRSGEVLL